MPRGGPGHPGRGARRLAVDAGRTCGEYRAQVLRKLPCRRVGIDAVWSFASAPSPNPERASVPRRPGDVWTWTGVCADTALVASWRVGDRSGAPAAGLVEDLRGRLACTVRVASDGAGLHLEAVRSAAAPEVDQAALGAHVRAACDDGADMAHASSARRIAVRGQAASARALPGKVANHAAATSLHGGDRLRAHAKTPVDAYSTRTAGPAHAASRLNPAALLANRAARPEGSAWRRDAPSGYRRRPCSGYDR